MENKYSNKYKIQTGMGLQDVDNLKNSSYFINESEKYIRGEITLNQLEETITSYYKNKPNVEEDDRSKEADIIAIRIAKLISDDSFTFTVGQLVSIHKQLFEGVFPHAGKIRSYNFVKKEWVLDGSTVIYGDYRELEATLQYDFDLERRFRYNGLSTDAVIEHLAIFIANLWQIHAFEEGNTRTTAVFFIKYLRSLGYDVTNDTFANNAWYFRNALVRANYRHIRKGIYEDRSFLIKFLRNLLLNEDNQLNNRDLHVSAVPQSETESRNNRIVKLMKDYPNIKTDEIAKELNISVRTIKSIIVALENKGTIKRVNGKKLGYWEVKEE
ncbi:MAG: Fic family protein [Bacilli bacterium]|nr:Fic family protein [Bacilli bacterium]